VTITDEMVDRFIEAFDSHTYEKGAIGLSYEERCHCKQCQDELGNARMAVRVALTAAVLSKNERGAT
jgi:hypothetical protein